MSCRHPWEARGFRQRAERYPGGAFQTTRLDFIKKVSTPFVFLRKQPWRKKVKWMSPFQCHTNLSWEENLKLDITKKILLSGQPWHVAGRVFARYWYLLKRGERQWLGFYFPVYSLKERHVSLPQPLFGLELSLDIDQELKTNIYGEQNRYLE